MAQFDRYAMHSTIELTGGAKSAAIRTGAIHRPVERLVMPYS